MEISPARLCAPQPAGQGRRQSGDPRRRRRAGAGARLHELLVGDLLDFLDGDDLAGHPVLRLPHHGEGARPYVVLEHPPVAHELGVAEHGGAPAPGTQGASPHSPQAAAGYIREA